MLPVTPVPRRHDLDWLRVLAFATLIVYHVGMFYVSWGWHVKSDYSSTLMEPVMGLISPWRLGLLFFISGVAMRFLLDSRGAGVVASDRIGRLLLPLGFGMIIVVMPQAYFELRAKGEIDPGILKFFGGYIWPLQSYSIVTPTWNHLWFLAYMLVYSLILCGLSRPLRRLNVRVGPAASAWLIRAPWLVLAVPALLCASVSASLSPWFPTTHMMVDDWATHARSITMVLVGWFVAKSAAFWTSVRECLAPAIAIAIGLGTALTFNTGTLGEVTAFVDVTREFYAWAVIVFVLGVAQRFFTRPSPTLRYATEAILPWYILHQSIIVAIGYSFIDSDAPLWAEVTGVLLGTALGCAILHEALTRRVSWLRPIFGLKPRTG
jgi:glucan biosynthesis protein C